MVTVMNAIAKPVAAFIHLPRLTFPRLFSAERGRKQATIDLIHSSSHLLRDIGATEDHFSGRHR